MTEDRWKMLISVGADLVTEYDRAVEHMISSSLKEKYPHYEYV
jgi:fructose-1,6-bisphosphatase/inositol monophosphatase family enzyme